MGGGRKRVVTAVTAVTVVTAVTADYLLRASAGITRSAREEPFHVAPAACISVPDDVVQAVWEAFSQSLAERFGRWRWFRWLYWRWCRSPGTAPGLFAVGVRAEVSGLRGTWWH